MKKLILSAMIATMSLVTIVAKPVSATELEKVTARKVKATIERAYYERKSEDFDQFPVKLTETSKALVVIKALPSVSENRSRSILQLVFKSPTVSSTESLEDLVDSSKWIKSKEAQYNYHHHKDNIVHYSKINGQLYLSIELVEGMGGSKISNAYAEQVAQFVNKAVTIAERPVAKNAGNNKQAIAAQ